MNKVERPNRLRRVQLAVPGSNVRMIERASASAADHVFLDLEDAVAPNAKAMARRTVIDALKNLEWGEKTVCVRINDTASPHCVDDIVEVVRGAGEHLDTIMIPKAMSARDIWFVDTLLSQIEAGLGHRRRIGLEALIEESQALLNIQEIATASPRMEALIFGMGDFAASQGVDVGILRGTVPYEGDIWYLPRFMVTAAARAAGLDAVDGPYASIRDLDGYRREAGRALSLGMVGKWALHPDQIAPALEIFTPRADDVALGRKLRAAYTQAQAAGKGSVEIDGAMIDLAVLRLFDNVLRRADLAGV